MIKLILILLAVHLLVCLVCIILKGSDVLKCEYNAIFIELFVPVFGLVILLFQSHCYRKEREAVLYTGLEKMRAQDIYKSIDMDDSENDDVVPLTETIVVNESKVRRSAMMEILYDINKSIRMEDEEDAMSVVPIEDVLRLNTSEEKRAVIMNVLYSNPEYYVKQLSEARSNDDSEVVHYAVTALVEIQKDFDIRLQNIIRKRLEDPDDRSLMLEYQEVLERYIASGLLSDSARKVQIRNLSEFLDTRLESEPDNWSLNLKKAQADLELEDGDALENDSRRIIEKWPEKENGYIFLILSCSLKKDRAGMAEIVKLIEKRNVHLSSDGEAVLRFWDL
ncbi:MAG: hypothetical protein ACOX71_01120 [Lachnospiraceae bacterium]|jgi:hypothetical protein